MWSYVIYGDAQWVIKQGFVVIIGCRQLTFLKFTALALPLFISVWVCDVQYVDMNASLLLEWSILSTQT